MKQDQASNAADALLSAAHINGRRAGLAGTSPSLCESSPGTPEYTEWMAGWNSGNDERERMAQRTDGKKMCPYQIGHTCDCGGKGLCLDVA